MPTISFWWQINLDKKEKKAKKEKEPFGKRHLAAFTAGMAFSAVMPALLENQPLIGYAMMGPYMDFIRVAYKSMPDDNWRTAFKALPLHLYFLRQEARYSLNPTPFGIEFPGPLLQSLFF